MIFIYDSLLLISCLKNDFLIARYDLCDQYAFILQLNSSAILNKICLLIIINSINSFGVFLFR